MQHKWLYLQVKYQPTNTCNDCSIVITINFEYDNDIKTHHLWVI